MVGRAEREAARERAEEAERREGEERKKREEVAGRMAALQALVDGRKRKEVEDNEERNRIMVRERRRQTCSFVGSLVGIHHSYPQWSHWAKREGEPL